MAITDTTTKTDMLDCDGVVTDFAFNFRILSESELDVYVYDEDGYRTAQAYGADYTVIPDLATFESGGEVKFFEPPENGHQVFIARNSEAKQYYDPVSGGGLSSSGIERALDRTIMVLQEIQDRSSRNVVQAATATGEMVFPTAEVLATHFLAFDAEGNPIAADPTNVPVTDFMQTVLDDETAEEARTTLGIPGAVVETVSEALKGIESVTLTNHDNNSLPAVAAGSYIEVNGSFYEFDSETVISGSAVSGLNYIKFAAGVPTWTDTASAWSDAKQGWYDGNDRYLFEVYYDGKDYYSKKKLYPEQNDSLILKAVRDRTEGALASQVGKIVGSDTATGDKFGSVGLCGNYLIVGAAQESSKGAAYIFKRDGASWTQQEKITGSDTASGDLFGYAVDIDGDYAIVGAYEAEEGAETDAGAAYIFKRDGTSWTQEARLATDAGLTASDKFGFSVSISGDYAAVGTPYDDDEASSAGAVYIFKRDGTSWDQQEKITVSGTPSIAYFGYSVDLCNDYLIIGAKDHDGGGGLSDAGAAYIYKRDGTSWTQEEELIASDTASGAHFGYSVSISGDYAVVGAYDATGEASGSGVVYIFKRDGTSWTEEQAIQLEDGETDDYFGTAVAICGDYMVAGAAGEASAYLFKRDGTVWERRKKLTPDPALSGNGFGGHCRMVGDYFVVGARNVSGVGAVFEYFIL